MTFEYKTDLATDDDEATTEVTFHLKDAGDVPVGILRRNRRDQDGLMWDTFEWAMPKDEVANFDLLTVTQVLEMFKAWQESQNDDGDKPKSKAKRGSKVQS